MLGITETEVIEHRLQKRATEETTRNTEEKNYRNFGPYGTEYASARQETKRNGERKGPNQKETRTATRTDGVRKKTEWGEVYH